MCAKRATRQSSRPLSAATLKQADNLLRQGQAEAALRCLDGRFGKAAERHAQAWMQGHALSNLGRARDAAAAFKAAIALNGSDPALWADLGQAQFGAGDFEDAAASLQRALELRPGVGQWQQALGVCLQQAGQFERAAKVYQEAIAAFPGEATLHYNLATVFKRLHRLDDASQAFAAARQCAPHDGELAFSHGVCLVELGDFAAAREALRSAADSGYELPRTLGFLSYVHTKLGEGDKALEAARKACSLAPEDLDLAADLTSAEVAAGAWQDVIASADRVLAQRVGDPSALSNKVIALVETGRTEDALALANPDEFVVPVPLEVPQGYADIHAFNQALVDHIVAHERIQLDLNSLSCHEGTTSGEILLPPLGPLAHFRRAIEAAAAGYIERLDPGSPHPFVRARPERLRMTAWLTVLRHQGYQHGHIHARAWLSGVYYLALPDGVGGGAGGEDGHIEFGRPPDYFPTAQAHPVRVLTPRIGQAFLFPSFYYHRTIPFSSDQARMSIAFDFDPA